MSCCYGCIKDLESKFSYRLLVSVNIEHNVKVISQQIVFLLWHMFGCWNLAYGFGRNSGEKWRNDNVYSMLTNCKGVKIQILHEQYLCPKHCVGNVTNKWFFRIGSRL